MFNGFLLDGFVVVSARHSIKLKNGALSVNWKMKCFHSAFCFVHVISNRLLNEPQMNFCLSHLSAKFLLHMQCRRVFPALCDLFLTFLATVHSNSCCDHLTDHLFPHASYIPLHLNIWRRPFHWWREFGKFKGKLILLKMEIVWTLVWQLSQMYRLCQKCL